MRDEIFPMLVVDAGNTSVKAALVVREGGKPRLLDSLDHRNARRIRDHFQSAKPRSAFAVSVAPEVTAVLRRACPGMQFVAPDSPLNCGCVVDRKTVGADRLANMAEAARRFGRRVVVADFGTAATFDLLDQDGIFAGGAIAPGLGMMAGALRSGTAQLPETVIGVPHRYAGRNTAEALRAGVAGGYAGLVRHLVAELSDRGTRLVFTGSDAPIVARLTGLDAVIDPLWTLRGVAVLGALTAREAHK